MEYCCLNRKEKYFEILGEELFVVLDGEVHNYDKLVNELKDFSIRSPEELIAAMFVIKGVQFISELQGGFGISIRHRERLFLYRDRTGLRSIYYEKSGSYCFGEFKPLLKKGIISPEINPNFLTETLVFGFQISDIETPIKEIFQVEKGSFVCFENHSYRSEIYDKRDQKLLDFNRENVRKLIEKNIERYKYFRKKICLSGGIDSSVVAILTAKLCQEFPAMYTLAGSTGSMDEHWASKVAKHIGCNQYIIRTSPQEMRDNLVEFINCAEIPGLSGIYLPNGELAFYILLKHLSDKEHSVLFTGDGVEKVFRTYSVPDNNFIRQRIASYEFSLRNGSSRNENIEVFFEQWKKDARSTYEHLLNYEWLEQMIVGNKIAAANNLSLVSPFLEENLIQCLDNAYEKGEISIGSKQEFENIFSDLFVSTELSGILHRKKMALPSALFSSNTIFEKSFDSLDLKKGRYGSLFTRRYEKVMFDIFYYIFIIRSCRGNFSRVTVEEIANDRDFKRMYD